MGRQLDPRISGLSFDKDDHPGCLSGVLHILRSYQWHNVKRRIPNKKFGGRRQAGGIRYSRLRSNIPDNSDGQGSVDAEVDDINVGDTSENSLSSKRSSKVHTKSHKGCGDRSPLPTFSSHYLRTVSIHHLEPSNDMLPDEVREDGKCHHEVDANTLEKACHPLLLNLPGVPVSCCNNCEFCDTTASLKNLSHNQLDELGRQLLDNALIQNNLKRAKEPFLRKKPMDAKEYPKDVEGYQSREVLDTLKMFDANNGLFQKEFPDSSYALAPRFQALHASNVTRGMIKSDSFPVDESSSRKSISASKFKHMQEVGFVDENAIGVLKQGQESPDIGQTITSSSPGPCVELKKLRFKDIKQKIKSAIKESRKEGHHISMDAIFHKKPFGSTFPKGGKREITGKSKESVMDRSEEQSPKSKYEDKRTLDAGKGGLNSMRKSQSLNESLSNYSKLFELNYGGETKQHPSNSSKITNESVAPTFSTAKALGRILSLPNLESYGSLHEESSHALSSGTPTWVHVDNNTTPGRLCSSEQKAGLSLSADDLTQLDAFVENAKENLMVVGEIALNKDQMGLLLDPVTNGIATEDVIVNDLVSLTSREDIFISQNVPDMVQANNANAKEAQPSPVSVLESCFQENISIHEELCISEGPELTKRQIDADEMNLHDQAGMDSLGETISRTDLDKVKIPNSHLNSNFRHVPVDKKDAADFNYVRDVLKLSRFSGHDGLGTWYSPEQPVDPSLFEEVETCSPPKSDCLGDEISNGYDHQLLFEIVNEVLLEIYDRSFTYWPLPLSTNCHIRPMPTGYHVLEEVWGIISWYLNSQPEFEPLDYLVVRDLSRSDGWMNLQFDSECVGLELEQMILDDLLNEVIDA